MARSRNIKPGFFLNEDLVELPFETRLLFIGLWTLADREGRLEDRPKKIKMAIFPADDLSVDDHLQLLHDSGMIVRYSASTEQGEGEPGKGTGSRKEQYIQIVNFVKHQKPHVKEAASTIPAPDEGAGSPGKVGASRPDSLLPLTDSLSLDSLSSECGCGASAPVHTAGKSCFVPPDWQPEEILPGQVRISPGVDIDHQLALFRLHEFAQPKSNWQAAWCKWLSQAKPERASPATKSDQTTDALRRFVNE